jgi:hypothetical protein
MCPTAAATPGPCGPSERSTRDECPPSFTRQIALSFPERYVVVFVGYTADDPPVQYLLEALNRDTGSSGSLYAFQASASADADSRWLSSAIIRPGRA